MSKLFLSIPFLICFFTSFAQKEVTITKHWQFRQQGTQQWHTAQVPGTVHTDLMANGLLPDPFYGVNEGRAQWVEAETWEYKTNFDLPAQLLKRQGLTLTFDGLDTDADVFLNGSKLLEATNMFRQWHIDVTKSVKKKNNELLVVFHPAAKIAAQKKASERVPLPDNERIYVRKAQYQFGWDWGPRLVTAGIWKEVRLGVSNQQEKTLKKTPDSWHIKLVQKKDSIGEAFYFTVNGKPSFIKGANWIPADSFLPRAAKLKRYEQLLQAAKEANINMLRVWGGGTYEDDAFYDLCDNYGIMVWQDFMFAGALYPGDSAFLKNVEEEVRYQVTRLRHHPSIALWCGNNEIEEAWFNWGWQKQLGYSSLDSAKLWSDYKRIFHQLIPSILKELDPKRPYWPSSPSLGWGRDSAYKKGDVHYWGVWWGQEPVEKYNEKVGRFNSEYGMQGMPDLKTIKAFATAADLDTSSAVMKAHQKHPFGYENIKLYINNRFKAPQTFENLVYVSQLMQADAVQTAIEAHRRNAPVTMGTLVWQWNDCWPVVSWSAMDYYARKKALFYNMKRSFADLAVLAKIEGGRLKATVVNDGDEPKGCGLIVGEVLDFTGAQIGVVVPSFNLENTSVKGLVFDADTAKITYQKGMLNPAQSLIQFVQQCGAETKVLNQYFFVSPKEMDLQKPVIRYKIVNKKVLEVTSNTFVYGVFVDVPDGVSLADNYFHLAANQPKEIKFKCSKRVRSLSKKIKIKSLADTYLP